MKDDRIYIEHILEALQRIAQYTADGEARFFTDTLIQDAVLRNLQTMAESTQRLSDPCKARYPELDWRAIAGFRNMVVHNYLGISLTRVWQIIQHDLPPLQQVITRMLADERHK